jgi:virginiamycin B lyase
MEFAVPVASGVRRPAPWGIVAGSDGNLWFTEEGDLQGVGRITTEGTITLLPTTPPGSTWGLAGLSDKIAAGADGALWFTEDMGNVIGRITTSGAVAEYPLPVANRFPNFVAPGPDGNMWFSEIAPGHIGTITPSGVITEIAIPGFTDSTVGITAGPDGSIWFVEYDKGVIGRVKP